MMTQKNTSWLAEAICGGHTDLFFDGPRETAKQKRDREARARVICGQCPVKEDCKQHGRDNEEHGIWGGETEHERFLAGYLNDPVLKRRMADRRRWQDPVRRDRMNEQKRGYRQRDKAAKQAESTHS